MQAGLVMQGWLLLKENTKCDGTPAVGQKPCGFMSHFVPQMPNEAKIAEVVK